MDIARLIHDRSRRPPFCGVSSVHVSTALRAIWSVVT
jgi:hypothetical protein